MSRLSVVHETRFRYATAVGHAHHLACLQPRSDERQTCEAFTLSIAPAHGPASVRTDAFGNEQHWFELCLAHDTLTVRSESVVDTHTALRPDWVPVPWERARDELIFCAGHAYRCASEFVHPSPAAPVAQVFADFASPSFVDERPLVDAVVDLMGRLHREVVYEAGATDVSTPPDVALAQRRGVCQDLAHIMIASLRSLGLSARYVSGYMLTDPPPGQARLLGADASHAWVQVWVPDLTASQDGVWLELDPTNNQAVDDRYVRVAIGRDYTDAAPLRGVIRGGGEHQIDVAVTVTPI